MTTEKKRDDEKGILIAIGVIFTGTLIAVDIFYGNMSGLFNSWAVWPFLLIHISLVISWGIVFLKFNDPNYDKWRKIAVGLSVAGILLVMGHRAGWLEEKSVIDDSNAAKQEEAK